MFRVFLSPSMQEYNIGAGNFGTEKDYCNDIADLVLDKFYQNDKISIIRSKKNYLTGIIDESNKIMPDLHLAIHTNADNSTTRGCEVFCYQLGGDGARFANIIYPKLSQLTPSTDRGVKEGKDFYGSGKSMFELEQTIAPACLLELDFHDNEESAKFLTENKNKIANIIADSINEFFGVKNIRHWADKDFEYLIGQGVNIKEKRYSDWMTRAEAITLFAQLLRVAKGGSAIADQD